MKNLKHFYENKTLPYKDKSLISQLMSGKSSFGEKVSRRLEEEYGMGSGYLDSVPADTQTHPNIIKYDNIEPARPPIRKLPLLGSVCAGHWQVANNFAEAEEWRITGRNCSEKSFALIVSGYSMQNHGRESFDPDDIILVDPEMPYNNGSLVIAINDEGEATFKKLFIEDGHYYLKALNPDWQPLIQSINCPTQICGVVFEKQVDF